MSKKVLVIGATGHVGTFLVPRLVEGGFEVVTMSRGLAKPYLDDRRWNSVKQIVVDRHAAEADGTFVPMVQAANAEIVIDMICFDLESAKKLVQGLQGRVEHFLHCG